jgi:hypothetical protein
MRGAIPPLPNTPSWRGDQLSTGTTLLTLLLLYTPHLGGGVLYLQSEKDRKEMEGSQL